MKKVIIKKRQAALSAGILICILITGMYSLSLYRGYKKEITEWNRLATDALEESLWREVKKRGNIPVPIISANSPDMHTLEEPYPDTLILESGFGKRMYTVPKGKLEHSLVIEKKKRMLISVLFDKFPLSVETLNQHWDSLLVDKGILARAYIKYSVTNFEDSTTVYYSQQSKKRLRADSLASYYMGMRCEMEVTGFIAYEWCGMFKWWQWAFLTLPWICLLALMFFYEPLLSYFKRRFEKKEIVIQEKEVVVEKQVVVEKEVYIADVGIKETKLCRLEEGVYFDQVERILSNGKIQKKVAPQIAALLKLFLRAENWSLTSEEIDLRMWNGKGNAGKLHTLISRLRETLEDVSSLVVTYDGNGVYQLKKPDFIEKSDTLESSKTDLTNTDKTDKMEFGN